MSTNAKYYLHGIQLPSGAWITDLTDTTPATNTQQIVEYAAGQFVPSFRGAHGARPEITFATTQLKTILDACGMTGVDYTGQSVYLYYRKAVNRGTRQAIAGAVHERILCREAYLYWQRISVSQGQLASIDCRLLPTYDGTNAPLVATGSVAIPAQQVFSLPYVLGPVNFNTGGGLTQVPGLASWTLELNPTIDEEASDGEDFLSWAGCQQHDPVLTCMPRDHSYWDSIGLDGLQLTGATFYARKRQADKTRVHANGQAEHIKFTAADNPCGMLTIEQSSGGVPDAAQVSLR